MGRSVRGNLILALANFGRLIEGASPDTALADTVTAADVRRSVLVDMSFRFQLKGGERTAAYWTLNPGFVFDAQQDKDDQVIQDASNYLFGGLSLNTLVGDPSSKYAEVLIECLAGQSEVMTGHELFSRSWSRETLRLRPRIFLLLDDDSDPDNKLFPLGMGLWTDLGFSDEFGDTYVLTFSKPFWRTW